MRRFAGHEVQFFHCEGMQDRAATVFMRQGLDAGHTCIIVATPQRLEQVAKELLSRGVDVSAARAGYRYIELDARAVLASFVVDGHCDRLRFHRLADTLMRQAASRGQPVRAYGEMVSLLVEDGHPDTAIELEELWNEFMRQEDLTIFCGYSANALASPACTLQVKERICALHTHAY